MRPQRPCRQPHGTVARYSSGCSCLPCCDAWREYQALRKADGPRTADGDDARRIIATLKRRGYSRRAIADGSGVAYRTLRAIESGESDRVRSETLSALMAFRSAPPTSTAWIPAARTIALIARIHDSGVSLERIAAELGISRSSLPGKRPQRCVQARIAAAVEELALSYGLVKRRVDEERVLILHAEGLKSEEIAAMVCASDRTVFRVLERCSA